MAAFWTIAEYIGIEVKQFRDTLRQHMGNVKKSVAERTRHKILYDRRVDKRQMHKQESKVDLGKALDADLVVMKSSGTESGKQDTSSRSGNDADADNADLKPVYDKEPMADVQLITESLKLGQHGPFLKVKSNEAKIKHEIDEIETISIELEHSVAILLTENGHLNKEKEHLKQTYKDPYDYNKKTRVKTKDHNDSLIFQLNNKSTKNANLKAQLQEKVFAIASLKNELRKLKENNLPKPVTQHCLPKERESAFAKPNHVIASSESRNSLKNMLRFSSNDMVHNHYLDEAKKKTQEKDRNSKSSVMHSTRLQNTTNGSKPKPRSNNQTTRSLHVSKSSCAMSNVVPLVDHSRNSSPFSDSKHFVCSTCHKCVFNANHDACITKFLKEIFTGHSFSPNKSSAVYEKTSPRSCLSKADSEPTHGSNIDISKIHVCKQTLDLSAAKEFDLLKWAQQVVSELVEKMMRIAQYIQMIDYALWEVIENGATLPKTTIVEGKEQVTPITSVEDKAQRKLEVKARSTLMMQFHEHQLKCKLIKDAKKL
ncbi:hypothetical protein Tco_0322841 [Tanacetum coccineum]